MRRTLFVVIALTCTNLANLSLRAYAQHHPMVFEMLLVADAIDYTYAAGSIDPRNQLAAGKAYAFPLLVECYSVCVEVGPP